MLGSSQLRFAGGGNTRSKVKQPEILMWLFFFLMLYLTSHLDGSIFLTLNIHCPVEYDQGSAKEDHFVTREGGREGGEEGEAVAAERD